MTFRTMTPEERAAAMGDLLDRYDVLREQLESTHDWGPELPKLELKAVSVEPGKKSFAPGDSPREGAWREAVERAAHPYGWARHRSGLWWSNKDEEVSGAAPSIDLANRDAERLRTRDPEAKWLGPPIWGEWSDGDGRSTHLRPDPGAPGLLRFYGYKEMPLGDGAPPEGVPVLAQDVTAIRRPGAEEGATEMPVLVYRVYWGGTDDDPRGLRRLFARFVRFSTRRACTDPEPKKPKEKGK